MLKDDFPKIWVPSRENWDLRQLSWLRHRMVQARTGVMNQLQAVELNEGLHCKKKLWRRHRLCGSAYKGRSHGIVRAEKVVVVDPFPIRGAHRKTIKESVGELRRVRSVGIDSPDMNLVRAPVKTPGKNDIAISAARHVHDPGIRIIEDCGSLLAIEVHSFWPAHGPRRR
jgi:hypothetical protein